MNVTSKQVFPHQFLSAKSLLFAGSIFVAQDLPMNYNYATWICQYVTESHLETATVWKHPFCEHNLNEFAPSFLTG